MMKKIYLKARAKINLSLEILNKRSAGYHNIESVFQKINLYDEMYIEKNDTNKFELETNIESINNNDNIIYKAYVMLRESYDSISGIKVILNKRIPMQAGLGGGSADCASFILGINKLFGLNLSFFEMKKIGEKLGADVVPCFYNKAILANGIGEKITAINTDFKYYIVIVKPTISCNTKEMYKLIDEENKSVKLGISNAIIQGLQKKDIELIAKNLYNRFEDVQPDRGLIQTIKEELIQNGALASLMTGSGSCVYGIFKDRQTAKVAFQKLKFNYQTYICTSYNSKRSENYV